MNLKKEIVLALIVVVSIWLLGVFLGSSEFASNRFVNQIESFLPYILTFLASIFICFIPNINFKKFAFLLAVFYLTLEILFIFGSISSYLNVKELYGDEAPLSLYRTGILIAVITAPIRALIVYTLSFLARLLIMKIYPSIFTHKHGDSQT